MVAKKYKLLINFGPLKKGGGQNVGLNFLQALQRLKNLTFEPYFIVCQDSLIHEMLEKSDWKDRLLVVDQNPVKRILQEVSLVRRFIREQDIDIVYTYFGFAPFGKKIKQIIGSADSNLYFPEIKFWKEEGCIGKIKRYLVDRYRIMGLKMAAGVIFENGAMYDRAYPLFGIDRKCLILPSIDEPLVTQGLALDLAPKSTKVLLLCGWQRNKNILLIPRLAKKLREKGFKVEFVLTVKDDGSDCAREFYGLVNKYGVQSDISCIGPVSKAQLPSLYKQIDQVLLLSLLESFSNNIIEAWYYKKPLIIADELWAKAICDDAALYVPRNDVDSISSRIIEVALDEATSKSLVEKGINRLVEYPSVDERLKQEIKFIESFVK